MRKRRANENDECRETRLSKQRKYKQQRRSVQKKSTAEELAQSKNTLKRNANKNSDCGEKKLSKQCKYTKQRQTEQRKTTAEGLPQPKNTQRFIAAQNKHTSGALPQSKNLQQPVFAEKNDTEERLHENKQYERSIDNLISNFHSIVSKGPLYICTCCDQLWYKHSVSLAGNFRLNNPNVSECLFNKTSVDNKEWLCNTCKMHLKKNKVPPFAAVNGMQFQTRPPFLDLNELEWRLLAPRLAFVKLMQAPRGNQLKINGNIVNVPADVSSTVNLLPRLENETGTIKVQLKRKLQYKSFALSLNVRPHKVVQAADWLITNSDLYKEEGIIVNCDWQSNFVENISRTQDEPHNKSLENSDNVITCNSENKTADNQLSCINENNWSEDEDEIPAGVTDTMLTATDFLDENERANILNVAPAEGSTPLSIFRDKFSEELAYPGIFLGQKRTENDKRLVPVHYSDICKSELRRSDRRAAMCVENIFFKAKKLQMKILLGKSQIAMRKCKGLNSSLTAGHLKKQGALEKLVHLDEGFKFLRALRGSPPYFETAKKDLFAMIRQLGPATLFCSFSSAETQWIHLLKILGKLVDDKEYSDNELVNLNWEQKCRLIQSDPVTCARHFENQFNQFLSTFLMSNVSPLGSISDWFYRVEYQQRGSPHIHMLLWIKNAPIFGIDDDNEVISFIDSIITCQKPSGNLNLITLVNRQIHRHSHSCRKRKKNECRFNYPQPPMETTQILHPLDKDIEPHLLKNYKEMWTRIKKELNDLKEGQSITFNELLSHLNVTEEDYLLALRSSLNSPTVFLKRKPNELRINNYNAPCLSAWRANMDIQFILDVYACAVYIVSYISKAQKGMSELLRKACDEAKNGNASIKQQVRDIGNKFLNSVEISAQEAVYLVLQIPMKKSSRQVIFIPTAPPDERVDLLKSMNEIEMMEDDCEDIHTGGLLKRYTERPHNLTHVTLADWAAWYDSNGKPYRKKTRKFDADSLLQEHCIDEKNSDDDSENNNEDADKSKKRSKARIIRSVWFNKETNPEKHYRELIMLFSPWRNEKTDLIRNCSTFEERFCLLKDEISKQMTQYAFFSQQLDEIQKHLKDVNDNSFDTIAPNTQHTELQDQTEGLNDLHPDFNETYDLSEDIGITPHTANDDVLILNELPDQEYRQMVQKLNKQQKEFFYHILHLIKTSDKPFYSFLSGGAGVGKSWLVKALYQAALKYYNHNAGEDFHDIKVLLLAPTGKASYNIKGNTIHSALAIPANQSLKNYKPLDSSRLNTLRCKLGKLKLIFVDEISMVGNCMFNIQINCRLKDIKGSKDDFGGVSIIAIGDLFQLKPVMDGYIFNDIEDLQYGVLLPNLWKEHFKMFELHEIMRQRESKAFAEILNRLREGNHTNDDLLKVKDRLITPNSSTYPSDAPHLFIQNKKVNEFNEKVHNASLNKKFNVKAQDSVVGANSLELRRKIMNQIPNDPRKTKQLRSNLKLSEGERVETAINVRTEDGITNGAAGVVKFIQLHQIQKPSGIIWVLFDHSNVGQRTRNENKHLYTQSIQHTWTPIKPVTVQFAVGKTKSARVVRKQFPLRPAAAKTVHRSQGDTETRIVVNLETKRKIPHVHYVALSRVTTIEGLYITDLCESKIHVHSDVKTEMVRLRTKASLNLCIPRLYELSSCFFKLCFLNARSLHKHIDDLRNEHNFNSADLIICSESRFSPFDDDNNVHHIRTSFVLTRFLTQDPMVVLQFIVDTLLHLASPTIPIQMALR